MGFRLSAYDTYVVAISVGNGLSENIPLYNVSPDDYYSNLTSDLKVNEYPLFFSYISR
jgi:hypothetical protein